MADTSTPALAPSQSKPDSSVAEGVKVGPEPNADSSKSEKWPFAESRPMREDQIKNAVNFLSHPSVRGTPMVQRFSFLERKGLTREEIEEAFRRCPDPPTSEAVKSLAQVKGTVPTPTQSAGFNPQPAQHYGTQLPYSIVPARTGPTWPQLILGAGLIAAAGAGTGYFLQKVLAPRLKRWLHDTLLEEKKSTGSKGKEQVEVPKLTPLEEAVGAAAAAANAAASAAAEVANTSREVLKLQTEEWQQFKSLISTLDKKTEELKGTLALMSKNLQGVQEGAVSTSPVRAEDASGFRGMFKPHQQTTSLAEQVQTKQGVQSINGIDKIYSNGRASNFSSHVSQSEDEPWWQHKKVEIETYSSPSKYVESTVQISEVDSELNQEIGSLGSWANTQNRGGPLGRPGWVPPPVPHTVMQGAASAIRYQKPAVSDDTKGPYAPEVKDMESHQSSGSVEAFSSSRLQNAVSLDEAVKAKVVTEDSLRVDEARPVASSASWYPRPAIADGAERAFASDEKEVSSQQPQLFAKTGSSMSSRLKLQDSGNVDEVRHTNVEDALVDKLNLRVLAEEKGTTFQLPQMSESVTDVVEITTFEPSKFSKRSETTSKDKETPSSSSLDEITEDVA